MVARVRSGAFEIAAMLVGGYGLALLIDIARRGFH